MGLLFSECFLFIFYFGNVSILFVEKKSIFKLFSKTHKVLKILLVSWNGSPHKLIYKKIGVYYSRWVLTSVGRVLQISLSITRISPRHPNLISAGHHHESDALTENRTTSSHVCENRM
jgi:hypothetical protein